MGDEQRIRELLAAGDTRRAAAEALRILVPGIAAYLHAKLRDRALADDALSLFAEGVWRGLPGFRWDTSLRGWGYTLARNAALRVVDDAFHRRGRRLETGEASQLANEIAGESAVRREREADALEKLRATLEPDDRMLLALRFDRDLSWEEIAVILSDEGTPVLAAAVRQRYQRLKRRLAEKARDAGLLD
jgi:RNA polymerase sigma-70 factor (ECF subfamily)